MADNKKAPIDRESVLHGVSRGKTLVEYGEGRSVFLQGQPADALFYKRRGKISLSAISYQGKVAIVAILEKGNFFGEGCVAGQALRIASATALTDCTFGQD